MTLTGTPKRLALLGIVLALALPALLMACGDDLPDAGEQAEPTRQGILDSIIGQTAAGPGDAPTATDAPRAQEAATPTATPAPVETLYRIAFDSDRDGNSEIYVMNSDGSGQTNLTNNPAEDRGPRWSPDGSLIAFVSDRDGTPDIYVMNSDGSGQTNLTNGEGEHYSPKWSPDGSLIAFVSKRDRDRVREINVMNSDGSGQTNLRNMNFNWDPRWSPDGSQIAYGSNSSGYGEIHVMNADGSGGGRLSNSGNAGGHFWTQDGRVIFGARNEWGKGRIFAVNVDDERPAPYLLVERRRATGNEWLEAISPDGSEIVFSVGGEGTETLYKANVDGPGSRGATFLVTGKTSSLEWSPDGSRIAFHVDIYTDVIMVMNADGLGITTLTDDSGNDRNPTWSPLEQE